jgi:hypothetical protein
LHAINFFEDQSSVQILPPHTKEREAEIELNIAVEQANETLELIKIPMVQNNYGSFSQDSSSVFPVFKSH